MDTSKFFKQLRQIIKEEVQAAVHSEMNYLYESLDKVSSKTTQAPARQAQPALNTAKKPVPNTKKELFSSNPLLNEILNETANSGFSNKEFHGILEEEYNPAQMNHNDFDEWPSMRNMSTMSSSPAAILPKTDIDGRPVQIENLDPSVEKALTKDYTALMKAINAKKGK